MADEYWNVVEPIWDDVSIYGSPEEFLEQFEKLSEKQKVLFSSHWAQSEIMNGGLGQFFSNPTGVLAPEAVWAFKKLGMAKCAKILSEAMKFFGSEYPRLRVERENAFESFYEKNGNEAIPLPKEEDEMATEIEDENGGFWDTADDYAKEN